MLQYASMALDAKLSDSLVYYKFSEPEQMFTIIRVFVL
jgi:hypothetical protein